MAGMLYLCATPIGNLEDITFRVLRTLKEVDLIAAEDTRNSQKLLNHFDIHTPMTSYHEYNKYDKAEYLVGLILDGKNIACLCITRSGYLSIAALSCFFFSATYSSSCISVLPHRGHDNNLKTRRKLKRALSSMPVGQ